MNSGELGHFSLLEKVGEGGMGRVYKARDMHLDRLVAIKVLLESRRADPHPRARFVQEAKAASALNHPNIITIHEIGEQDGQTFIVMELVDGKPLHELIPRRGMRLTEALRIAAQVAGALTAAHAAGIVHRDLKPANIMVDADGRVKVLDFGLAKLSATATAVAVGADEATRTLTVDQPVTEEGVILGSVPYMSPEQAEGKPVDARSDIFSFGAMLYEMTTGQRAFRGESRVSTLAAIVERDPPSPSEIASTTPPELGRLIMRCLRKDVNRRSQHMSDVKLALEELLDESESGKLARPAATAPVAARRSLWLPVAVASVLIATVAFAWMYVNSTGTQSRGPDLVRLSPDDGHSYSAPAISPDGGLVAYVSNRSGKAELWLQQVGGGDPIRLTHSNDRVGQPAFFPDGKRILYVTTSADSRRSALEVIPALGGDPRVLIKGGEMSASMPSPDGHQIAFFEHVADQSGARLMTISSNGGEPRELSAWARMHSSGWHRPVWTSDSRHLLCRVSKVPEATNADQSEWFVFRVDEGNPVATGAGEALRAAGLKFSDPLLITGDRVLFAVATSGRYNVWEIRLSPASGRVQGVPHQLTFGTMSEVPESVSATGTVALKVVHSFTDLYLVPLSPSSGQPTGVARRLARDQHLKVPLWGGDPGTICFVAVDKTSRGHPLSLWSLDFHSGRQTPLLIPSLAVNAWPVDWFPTVALDGRQIAYPIPEGDSYSIRLEEPGKAARTLCRGCGVPGSFSADGRFLFLRPDIRVASDPKQKSAVRLLEVATGRDRTWLEHPTNSISKVRPFGENAGWIALEVEPLGAGSPRVFILPWREEPVPTSEWIEVKFPTEDYNWSPAGNFFYFFQGSTLMAIRFDSKTRAVSEPFEVKFPVGSPVDLGPGDFWQVRRPGLVFSHVETNSSVWLMKLPQ